MLGVYKRHQEEGGVLANSEDRKKEQNQDTDEEQKKPFMWLHPPPKLELNYKDELFVLAPGNPKESYRSEEMFTRATFSENTKVQRNEEKKSQRAHVV